jgi:hypothetical protein
MPQVHFRACNGQYVCAVGGGGRELVANRSQALEWETFTIEIPPRPPLHHDTGDVSVGAGKHMQTNVTLQPDGLMITETRIENHVKFVGWGGVVQVFVCDVSGNILANGPMRRYGVDGQWMPTGPWRRIERKEDHVDPSVYDQAHHFVVFQKEYRGSAREGWEHFSKWVHDFATTAKPALDTVAKIADEMDKRQ